METLKPDAIDATEPNQAPPPKFRVIRESSEEIRIDEEGRIWRMNGELIQSPGLEPEHILSGLADLAAGRMVSLEEYRARRQ